MPEKEQPPRFLVDRRLVRLGKYLRIIGADATWRLDLTLPFLIARAHAADFQGLGKKRFRFPSLGKCQEVFRMLPC